MRAHRSANATWGWINGLAVTQGEAPTGSYEPKKAANGIFRQSNDILLRASMRHKDLMNAIMEHADLASDHSATASRTKRSSPALVGATIAIWLAAWALLTARAVADGSELLSVPTAVRSGMALFGCCLCFIIMAILQRLQFRRFYAKVLIGAVLASVAAEIFGWVSVAVSWLAFGKAVISSPGMTILILGFYAWIFFSWVTLYLAVSYNAQAADAEHRAAKALAEASSAQLRALRYQLNPHFLFNTLNSLSALILEQRTRDADEMVVRLSSFLRTTLSTEALGLIRAEDEIEAQRRYLEIEQVRFPDLTLRTEVDPQIADAAVPPMILQPLVENAIKFAVGDSPRPAQISVSAYQQGQQLVLTVEDSGSASPSPQHGMGVGLRNVRDRLKTLFGDDAQLETRKSPDGGFSASLFLPLERLSC
jgi:two-component sensor histidine kinase